MVYKYLGDSPIFHFSLHSKELFHSNFIAWLGMDPELREVFKNVMESIGLDREYIESWDEDFIILREKDNLDLIVKAKDSLTVIKKGANKGKLKTKLNKKLYVVIENKLKSIPTDEQLDEYSEKINIRYGDQSPEFAKILLSIEVPENINSVGWRIATYRQVIEGLEKPLTERLSVYKSAIISDYVQMLKSLVAIMSDIKVSADEPFLNNMDCDTRQRLKELRIDDLYEKWRAAKVANLISMEIGANCTSGYTNNSPFIETSLNFSDDKDSDSGTIQIQGSQYRHCICTTKCENDLAKDFENFLYKNHEEFAATMTDEFKNVFTSSSQKLDFCCYGKDRQKPFWYQYVNISPDATVKQIAQCIKADLGKLLQFKKVSKLD